MFDLPEPVASPRPSILPSGSVRVASVKRTVERPEGPVRQLVGLATDLSRTLRRGALVPLVTFSLVAVLGAVALGGPADSSSNAVPDDRLLMVQESSGLTRTDVTAPPRVEPAPAKLQPPEATPIPAITTVPSTVASPVTSPPRILAKATVTDRSAS